MPRRRLGNADLFKNIFLKLRFTARKARTVSASGPPIVPSIHEGEKPMFFPPRGSPFSLHNRRSSLPPLVGPAAAAGQIPALSASMACFICPGLFWAARRARFGAWAAERRDKSAYSIKHASFNYCRSVAHAPNLT